MVLGLTSHLAVISQMLITKLAYMLALTLVAPMGRLCRDRFTAYPSFLIIVFTDLSIMMVMFAFRSFCFSCSGNTKWVLVWALKLQTTSGVQDIFLR